MMTTTKNQPSAISFEEVITSRRSVRRFTDTPITDEVLNSCLDMAMLAPNSSNLQPWQFFVINSDSMRQKAVEYCLNQSAARTASRLIVLVARTDTWQQHAKDNIKYYPIQPAPKSVKAYYTKLIPVSFALGKLNVLAPAKWAITQAIRHVKGPIMDPFYSEADIKNWALISTSLAAQNLMLAFRAHGFDTCPMGGFDEPKMKQLLGLNEHQYVCMVIAAGERADRGIYSEQYRFDRSRFVVEV